MTGGDDLLKGVRVLAVDDDDDYRDLLRMMLEHHGAKVIVCGSARSALDVFARARPDVIVCDLVMPGEGGDWLLGQIRRLENGATVPAIAVSSYHDLYDPNFAESAGFSFHMPKPVKFTELARAVAALLGRG